MKHLALGGVLGQTSLAWGRCSKQSSDLRSYLESYLGSDLRSDLRSYLESSYLGSYLKTFKQSAVSLAWDHCVIVS